MAFHLSYNNFDFISYSAKDAKKTNHKAGTYGRMDSWIEEIKSSTSSPISTLPTLQLKFEHSILKIPPLPAARCPLPTAFLPLLRFSDSLCLRFFPPPRSVSPIAGRFPVDELCQFHSGRSIFIKRQFRDHRLQEFS
jgi:hypothetical protein